MNPPQGQEPGLDMSQPTDQGASPYMLQGAAPTVAPSSVSSPTSDDQVQQPLVAGDDDDDTDLDRIWADKAKAVIESTYGQPFERSQQIAKLKADYLKVRFDKDIKVAENPKQ